MRAESASPKKEEVVCICPARTGASRRTAPLPGGQPQQPGGESGGGAQQHSGGGGQEHCQQGPFNAAGLLGDGDAGSGAGPVKQAEYHSTDHGGVGPSERSA